MGLEEFCSRLAGVQGLDNAKTALAILWWHDSQENSAKKTSGELSRTIKTYGLGNPNSTSLYKGLSKSKLTLKDGKKYCLKAGTKKEIRKWIQGILDGTLNADVDQNIFLPEVIWKKSRGHIESVCGQINGSYQ